MKAGNIILKTINILFVLIVIMAFIVDYISIKKEFEWQDVIRIELYNKKTIYCTAFKKSDGWITCYSQGQPRYQIPIKEIKLIEYKENQNVK